MILHNDPIGYDGLLEVIGRVRRRWRLKLFLRGAAVVTVAGLLAFLVSAFVVEKTNFSPAAVLGLRFALAATVLVLAVRYLLLPLARRVTNSQVALYLEEHEPSLQAAVLSAIELDEGALTRNSALSVSLAHRTIEDAIRKCEAVHEGRAIERTAISRSSAVFAAAALAALLLGVFRPGFLRHGADALLFRPAAAASPYRIDVQPGNVTIPRGADQMVGATLHGFASDYAEVVVRTGADSAFHRIPMVLGPDSTFELMLFAIGEDTDYYIEATGTRSPVHRITVADLPYVESLVLEYHFPAYTGLEPRIVDPGGDIAVLAGTRVRVIATTTVPVDSGAVVVDGTRGTLASDGTGALVGAFTVLKDGFYHLEFPDRDGRPLNGSPQYTIDVLTDLPPTVSFSKPGRDTRVSSIEEVFLEARAEDDFGIADIDLVYSVNGGEERTLRLYEGGRALREVTAGHTIFLEEMELQAGDLIAYYARAHDNAPGGQRKEAVSDIYFLNVRPFGLEYRQSEQPPGGGGGGGGEPEGQLSEQQREIVAATFNILRDSATTSAGDLEENLVTVALAQERLREQALTLAGRISNRGVSDDSSFAIIARLLPEAAAEMEKAAGQLRNTQTALGINNEVFEDPPSRSS